MGELPNCVGLDIGTHRIGVATHPQGIRQAMPFETVDARDTGKSTVHIAQLIIARQARVVVVGWPLDMDGVARMATRRVDAFIERLERSLVKRSYLTYQIVRWDERMTTTAAEAMLIRADVSRLRRKQVVDQIAATHILDSYLSSLVS